MLSLEFYYLNIFKNMRDAMDNFPMSISSELKLLGCNPAKIGSFCSFPTSKLSKPLLPNYSSDTSLNAKVIASSCSFDNTGDIDNFSTIESSSSVNSILTSASCSTTFFSCFLTPWNYRNSLFFRSTKSFRFFVNMSMSFFSKSSAT